MSNVLLQAIYNDDFETAKQLIKENKDDIINAADENDEEHPRPINLTTDLSIYDELTEEIRKKLNELAICLIKSGVIISIPHSGMLPIHYAAYNGSLEVFQALVEAGSDYNSPDIAGLLPSDYAALQQNSEISNYILSLELKNLSSTGQAMLPYFKCNTENENIQLENIKKATTESKTSYAPK